MKHFLARILRLPSTLLFQQSPVLCSARPDSTGVTEVVAVHNRLTLNFQNKAPTVTHVPLYFKTPLALNNSRALALPSCRSISSAQVYEGKLSLSVAVNAALPCLTLPGGAVVADAQRASPPVSRWWSQSNALPQSQILHPVGVIPPQPGI